MATNPAVTAQAESKPAEDQAKTEGQAPAAENAVPKAKAKSQVLVFDPRVKKTLNSTQHTITKVQLVEAGVKNPFSDEKTTQVTWGMDNNFRVAADLFTEDAINRLVKEADISLADED